MWKVIDSLINICLRLKWYGLAYKLAARYMPPHYPLNFDDEQGA
jgi:hypothetical protein